MADRTERAKQLAIIAKEFETALQEAKICPYVVDASCPVRSEVLRVLERRVEEVSRADLSNIIEKVRVFLRGTSRTCRVLYLLQDAKRRKEMYGL